MSSELRWSARNGSDAVNGSAPLGQGEARCGTGFMRSLRLCALAGKTKSRCHSARVFFIADAGWGVAGVAGAGAGGFRVAGVGAGRVVGVVGVVGMGGVGARASVPVDASGAVAPQGTGMAMMAASLGSGRSEAAK